MRGARRGSERGGVIAPSGDDELLPNDPDASELHAELDRKRHQRALGMAAENVVAEYLAERGLAVIGRNVRVGRLEIDLLARDGPVIVVVEVRTRGPGSFQRALDSIDARKQARIRRAGETLWRIRFSDERGIERMRFDAASVTFQEDGSAVVEHIRAAF